MPCDVARSAWYPAKSACYPVGWLVVLQECVLFCNVWSVLSCKNGVFSCKVDMLPCMSSVLSWKRGMLSCNSGGLSYKMTCYLARMGCDHASWRSILQDRCVILQRFSFKLGSCPTREVSNPNTQACFPARRTCYPTEVKACYQAKGAYFHINGFFTARSACYPTAL